MDISIVREKNPSTDFNKHAGKIISKVEANLGKKLLISPTCQLPCFWQCLTNQLWPFSYMSNSSGHSAGKLLEKDITYMPVDVRNSGWYLVAASTLCHSVQWLWCGWDTCDLQWTNCRVYLHVQSCASHTVHWGQATSLRTQYSLQWHPLQQHSRLTLRSLCVTLDRAHILPCEKSQRDTATIAFQISKDDFPCFLCLLS